MNVRVRWFRIWQALGYNPWKTEWTIADDVPEGNVKGFYRGAFDSIPFLNDDAKRTFLHLLLRPGYMIRDYIKGKHDIYLAPLTSLIIFYAFFSLVSSIAHPDFENKLPEIEEVVPSDTTKVTYSGANVSVSVHSEDSTGDEDVDRIVAIKTERLIKYIRDAYVLIHLDQHPEAIDTPKKASLAAFESALRSQGVDYFLGLFIILWPAMRFALRKRSMGWAASATTAAYVLCQFSFFMLFALILSWGKNNEIGTLFMGLLIMIDYHQLFGIGYKMSLWLTVKTGLYLLLMILFLIFLLIVAITIYVII